MLNGHESMEQVSIGHGAPGVRDQSHMDSMDTVDGTMSWGKLRGISAKIYGARAQNGQASTLLCTANNIFIGTQSAEILMFSYEQKLISVFQLPTVEGCRYGAVTCLCVSEDGKVLAAGFSQGFVGAWHLVRAWSPYLVAEPITHIPNELAPVPGQQSHMLGTPVLSLFFAGGQNDALISGDSKGVVVLHHLIQLFLKTQLNSRKLLGSYDPLRQTALLACRKLTLDCGSRSPTLFAVLTPAALSIYSYHDPRTDSAFPRKLVFRYLRSNFEFKATTGFYGTLAWHRQTESIAYSWGNTLSILRSRWKLSSRGKSIDKKYSLECTAERTWSCSETIVFMDWFRDDTLVVLTVTGVMLFLDLSELKVLDTVDVSDRNLIHQDFFSPVLRDRQDHVVADAVANSIQVRASAVLMLGKYEFAYGYFTNWADRLMAFLNKSRPVEAILLAVSWLRDTDDLSLIGLDPRTKKDVIQSTLPDIIITSLRFSLEHDQSNIPKLLNASVSAIILSGIPLLEKVFDLVHNTVYTEVLIQLLVPFILDGKVSELPPSVFKEILSAKADSDVVQDIIYSLDPSTLDLDLAFSVCRDRNLAHVEIFLLSSALGDFTGPLTLKESGEARISYLRSVLRGYTFPTGQPFPPQLAQRAKDEIYRYLFFEENTMLQELLADNPEGLLLALDEAFEDSFLNEDTDTDSASPITRQMVVDILSTAIESMNENERGILVPYYQAFVARNLAKYPQFLQLPASLLETLVRGLCTPASDNGLTEEQREYALMSLLSVYKPENLNAVLDSLYELGLFRVLEQLYRSKGDYKNMFTTALHFNDTKRLWTIAKEYLGHDRLSAGIAVCDSVNKLCQLNADALADLVLSWNINTVFEKMDSVDEQLQFKFYSSIFEKLEEKSSQMPLCRVTQRYLHLVTKYDGPKLMSVLAFPVLQQEDLDIPQLVDVLKQEDRTDALAFVLCREKRFEEALDHVINHLGKKGQDSGTLSRFCEVGANVCKEFSSLDAKGGCELWKRLLEATLTANLPVQKIIETLINSSPATNGFAISVLSSVMASGEVPKYAIAERALVIFREQKFLVRAIKDIMDNEGFSHTLELVRMRVQGWSVALDGDCESCGKKVVGMGIDAEKAYNSWRERETRHKIPDEGALIVFKCGHTYHLECLTKLAPDSDHLECLAHPA